MSDQVDDQFFDLADAYLALANEQCDEMDKEDVSACFLYGAARFNAYVGALNSGSGQAMQSERENLIHYYLEEYKKMLTEHLDDYIANYDEYMELPMDEES